MSEQKSSAKAKPFLVPTGNYAKSGYTPSALKHYYAADGDFPTGKGITCGIVTAYGSPTLIEDLAVFSQTFALPEADITLRGAGNASERRSEWILESSLDSQWFHAFAPDAKLLCYFAPSDDFSDIMETVRTAEGECDIVSLSFGRNEDGTESRYEEFFRDSRALFVAAAGDGGAVQYPSCSPYVLCVGGTLLYLDAQGDASGEESVWSGTGSGVSRYLAAPEHQSRFGSIARYSGGKRAVPDLAFFAQGERGAAFYHSTVAFGRSGWTDAVGTSVGAPCVAGICACLAERDKRVLSEKARFFYDLAGGTAYTNPYRAFFDIVLGQSGVYAAAEGFDFCSGLGSPRARRFLQNKAPAPQGTGGVGEKEKTNFLRVKFRRRPPSR